MTGALLSDLRVIEFSNGIEGAFCCKLLAERGAEVIKVETPGTGDPTRWQGPFLAGGADPESSALFMHLNTTKKSVTLDVSTNEGQSQLRNLIATADVFVENEPPGRLATLGLGYDDLKADAPSLIYVSITPYGLTGPYRDYRGNALSAIALSGVISVTGWPDREPLATGVDLAGYFAGIQAWLAILAALAYRDKNGVGQYIDVSAMEAMATADESAQITYGFMGIIRRGTTRDTSGAIHRTLFPAKPVLSSCIPARKAFPRPCEKTRACPVLPSFSAIQSSTTTRFSPLGGSAGFAGRS